MKFLNKIDGASQVTTDSSNRFVTDAEKTKLAGIATAATKNDTDANLKNRANHTGSQTSSTISDFAATVRTTVLTGLSTATNAVVAATDTVLVALGKLQKQIIDNLSTLTTHTGNKDNPHGVTKTHINLGNVDNTSDASKPISDATQTVLNGKVDNSRVLTDVPASAKFTDTVYTHPTTAGNKHIPTGGTTGQFLKYSASGTAVWAADNNTVYTHPTTDGNLHVPATGTENNDKVLKAGAEAGSLIWATDNDTITTINGKTGAIVKADITALGIPAQALATARFVIGTSTAGWTATDCDYLCDGTADDVEINAAITALPATGGEIVILDGTYNITAKINVTKNNVSIRGNGNATILKRMYNNSTSEGIITLTSVSGCKIADLQVDGNKTSYSNSNNYSIYLEFTSNNTITGNTYNNNNYGIYSYGSSSNTITSNTCSHNSNYGIYLYNSSNSNTVTGNTCNDNNNTGIYLVYSSNNNTVTGNTCNNNNFGSGIRLSGSSNNTVTGNTCNNSNYSTGIDISESSNDNTIIGNTCNNNKDKGINLDTSRNNAVTSNICNNNTSYGINLEFASNNTIIGNTCNYNSLGIYLSYGGSNAVTGNTCNNNTSYGIHLSNTRDNTITGNTCNYNNLGIYLSFAKHNTVTGNNFNNNNYGIRIRNYSSNNTVAGNTCIRGTGLTTDYTVSQHTIEISGTDNNYNLISNNNCMGKAVTVGGGTGNTLVNNKFDDSDNDTITTINGKTGAIVKADITALGIPAQDTTYTAGAGLKLTGTVFTPNFGSAAGTVTQGNDSRLSNARPADGGNADTLDGFHRAGLYTSPGEWITANGHTVTITVTGSADTYYPVVVRLPGEKTALNNISIWKNLSSPTATYSGNHSNGTSSMWLVYEGRSMTWDGNGGYYKCLYYSMPYATLCAKTDTAMAGVGALVVYLRGGGTLYNFSGTYSPTVDVYYQTTDIGTGVIVTPVTALGNLGRVSGAPLGYGDIVGNATTATTATNANAVGGKSVWVGAEGSKGTNANTIYFCY